MSNMTKDDLKTAVATGVSLANGIIENYAAAKGANNELIRSALLEGLAVSSAYATLIFESCDKRLEEEGFRTVTSSERSYAKRIIAGAAGDAKIAAKVVEMMQNGERLQDVAAECPKLTNRGRPSGKGRGESAAPEGNSGNMAQHSAESVAEAFKSLRDPQERAKALRYIFAQHVASVTDPDVRKLAQQAIDAMVPKTGTK